MKKYCVLLLLGLFISCQAPQEEIKQEESFEYVSESFADIRVLRYQVPGFERLSLNQKKLVYYLVQAGISGRDIIWDQNYRHNLAIRSALENIVKKYEGDKEAESWKQFMIYTKRVWFANGIHHHYGMDKFEAGFSREYFSQLLSETGTTLKPEAIEAIFDPSIDAKKVNLDREKGLLLGSATNFYDPDVTEEEV